MLLNLICGECLKENVKNNTLFVNELMIPVSQIEESGIYHVTCDKGHKTLVALRNAKFELLFDLGVHGVIDGYFREGVSSFTASLERFYEFFIRVAFYNDIDNGVYNEIWKIVKNQSERQFGAYLFVYAKVIKKAPQFLSSNAVSFRNDVIHKGLIPNREKTLEYGEEIRKIVNGGIIEMKLHFGNSLITAYESYLPTIEGGEDSFGCNIPTILDVCHGPEFEKDDVRNGSLEEIIPSIINNRSPHRITFSKESNQQEK